MGVKERLAAEALVENPESGSPLRLSASSRAATDSPVKRHPSRSADGAPLKEDLHHHRPLRVGHYRTYRDHTRASLPVPGRL